MITILFILDCTAPYMYVTRYTISIEMTHPQVTASFKY